MPVNSICYNFNVKSIFDLGRSINLNSSLCTKTSKENIVFLYLTFDFQFRQSKQEIVFMATVLEYVTNSN